MVAHEQKLPLPSMALVVVRVVVVELGLVVELALVVPFFYIPLVSSPLLKRKLLKSQQ
jgi:hypothetical protein